ncbi:hypothetical protein OAG24_00785 [bacterium]|nr:hypothetical protein [bacterium]
MFLVHIEPSSYGTNCKYNHGIIYNEFILLKKAEFDNINSVVSSLLEKETTENQISKGLADVEICSTKTHDCILEFDIVDIWESARIIQVKTPSDNYKEIMNIKKFDESNFKNLMGDLVFW